MGSSMLNRLLVYFILVAFASPAIANPSESLPETLFTRVDDPVILGSIGLSSVSAAWCYSDEANSVLISAASRERDKCRLQLSHELEKQKVKYQFKIDALELRVNTLMQQQVEINKIKDEEIERLTDAAMKRPNDYSVWWASGGVLTGALTTLLIVSLVK